MQREVFQQCTALAKSYLVMLKTSEALLTDHLLLLRV